MENTKKTKKKVRTKGQKIRSIIMMALLCIAMLSGATYAWFTLSNTARVTNMQLTVGDASGLMIAPEENNGPGTYSTELSLKDAIKGKLLPATTKNGKTFLKPDYNEDGNVYRVIDVGDDEVVKINEVKTGHYFTMNFYLKPVGGNLTVKLKAGNNLKSVENDTLLTVTGSTGTYFKYNKQEADGKEKGAAAIRISLTKADSTSAKADIVYEPNSDYDNTAGSKAQDIRDGDKSCVESNVIQKMDGSIIVPEGKTEGKIDLTGNADNKITMNIWIEGTDVQCVNEISAAELIGQLQFEDANQTH